MGTDHHCIELCSDFKHTATHISFDPHDEPVREALSQGT